MVMLHLQGNNNSSQTIYSKRPTAINSSPLNIIRRTFRTHVPVSIQEKLNFSKQDVEKSTITLCHSIVGISSRVVPYIQEDIQLLKRHIPELNTPVRSPLDYIRITMRIATPHAIQEKLSFSKKDVELTAQKLYSDVKKTSKHLYKIAQEDYLKNLEEALGNNVRNTISIDDIKETCITTRNWIQKAIQKAPTKISLLLKDMQKDFPEAQTQTWKIQGDIQSATAEHIEKNSKTTYSIIPNCFPGNRDLTPGKRLNCKIPNKDTVETNSSLENLSVSVTPDEEAEPILNATEHAQEN